MDAQALQNEAKSAISGAKTLDELDAARVRYLGRKSELKQALREVRDPETGRVLNTLREQLERAIEEREAALRGADLEQRNADIFISSHRSVGRSRTSSSASDTRSSTGTRSRTRGICSTPSTCRRGT